MDSPPTPPKTIQVRSDTYQSFEVNGAANKPAGRSTTAPLTARSPKGRVREPDIWPKPSISEHDPLNWSPTKKNLHFTSLLLLTATSSVLKTLLVTVTAPLATEFSISYLQAASFTGVPYIFAALSALGSEVLAKIVGKRALVLGAALLMLTTSLGNMHLHQRPLRIHLYHITSFTFTYGTPILGGWLSQGPQGFGLQIMILNIVQSLSILLLIFCTPECTFSAPPSSPEPKILESSSINTRITTSPTPPSVTKSYLKMLHPMPFFAKPESKELMIPLKTLIIPSTLLTTAITALLPASALAVSNSLSLLFASMPIFLFPSRIGYLFILPLSLGLVTYVLSAVLTTRTRDFRTLQHPLKLLCLAVPGVLLGVAGLLAFGLYVLWNLKPRDSAQITMFNMDITGQDLSLRVVSLLLGILVAGVVLMHFSTVASSSLSFSSHMGIAAAGMERAVGFHQSVLTGLLILVFPPAVQTIAMRFSGLRTLVVVLVVLQFVVGSTALAILWVLGEGVRRRDERVLGGWAREGRGVGADMEELGKEMQGSWMER
ncbi:hypothetical protein B7494_g6718 [Chlorociboria aeruginascens]|nr:hypothetical protein B7494_g6718 [Chlorociboria aeruginascens]